MRSLPREQSAPILGVPGLRHFLLSAKPNLQRLERLFHLYGLLEPWFDKTWRVREVELVN
jgi:hypothetical protein